MSENVPNVPIDEGQPGNTKKVSPAIRWCFTLNNYNNVEIDELITICSKCSKYYIWGYEVGEEGTPHLQGYVEFKTKHRPKEVIPNVRIHWEKCKGNRESNFSYCSKGGDYFINGKRQKPLKLISKLRPWQADLMNILNNEADDRSILWYWDEIGNIGKSAFCKYLCAKHDALIVGGKIDNMKNAILKWNIDKGTWPEIVIFDVPRTSIDYLNYAGMEEIKNGCFYSGKYEGGMVLMNSPHVLVFANEEPDISKMSKDRWVINEIELEPRKKKKPKNNNIIMDFLD